MATTFPINEGFKPIDPRVYTSGTVPIPEKASCQVKQGGLLVMDANGFAGECGAAPAVIAYVAAEDGHNAASDGLYDILAWPVNASDLWEVSLKDVLAQSLFGTGAGVVGVVKDASGYWTADNDEAGDQVKLVRAVLGPGIGAIGDTNCRVIVQFQSANIQFA